MARKTLGELRGDLELRLTEGKPSNDFDIDIRQMNLWLDMSANSLIADKLGKQLSKGEDIDWFYVQKSALLTPASENISGVDSADQRYILDISAVTILPFQGHERTYGIIRINDETNAQVTNITSDDDDWLQDLWFSNASKDDSRFQWYGEGATIIVKGVDSTNVSTKKFRLFYVGVIDSNTLTDATVYPIGEDLMPLVVELAEQIALRELKQGTYDVLANSQQNS